MKRIGTLALVGLLAAIVVVAAACGAQGGSDTPDGEALVGARCSECHPLTRVTTANMTQAQWQQTVERMVANGAVLNEAEQQAVIEYLAETYPAS